MACHMIHNLALAYTQHVDCGVSGTRLPPEVLPELLFFFVCVAADTRRLLSEHRQREGSKQERRQKDIQCISPPFLFSNYASEASCMDAIDDLSATFEMQLELSKVQADIC
eukprot:6264523-Amphidinium_carterae.2